MVMKEKTTIEVLLLSVAALVAGCVAPQVQYVSVKSRFGFVIGRAYKSCHTVVAAKTLEEAERWLLCYIAPISVRYDDKRLRKMLKRLREGLAWCYRIPYDDGSTRYIFQLFYAECQNEGQGFRCEMSDVLPDGSFYYNCENSGYIELKADDFENEEVYESHW